MVEQLLTMVEWGELDYLVVDLPPGTGDASLTLAQKIPLSGLVLVATPQDVALADASRAMAMFRQLKVPIIGIVENMSYFVCSGCDQRHDLFGRGGAARMAAKEGIDLLGEIPLDPSIRVGGDIGQPILVREPRSPQSAAFREIAGRVAAKISVMTFDHESAGAR
jgi:ATP-binding protein involved in chromosome partitioning